MTAVSAGLAFAADQALVHALAVPEPRSDGPALVATRQVQIIVFHSDRPSTVIECMAPAERASSDVLEFWDTNAALEAISSMCSYSVGVN